MCMFACFANTYNLPCSYVHISSTIKQDCKAGVKLSLSDDGQHLVVNEVNEENNHDITKVCQS